MKANMDEADLEDFNKFIEKHWEKQIKEEKMKQEKEIVSVGDEVKKRGRKPKIEQ